MTAMLRPVIIKASTGDDALAFKLSIEKADFAGLPAMVDDRITEKVNHALATKLALCWNFSETLSRSVDLPVSFRPLETLKLKVAWGKVRVTDEAMVMAISFHSDIERHGTRAFPSDSPPKQVLDAPASPDSPAVMSRDTSDPASISATDALTLGASALALVIGGAYGAYRLASPRRGGDRGPTAFSLMSFAGASIFLSLGARVLAQIAREADQVSNVGVTAAP
ncbi:MAG: hypothetical protein NVS3B20_16420 [Polyangiales bacterium]